MPNDIQLSNAFSSITVTPTPRFTFLSDEHKLKVLLSTFFKAFGKLILFNKLQFLKAFLPILDVLSENFTSLSLIQSEKALSAMLTPEAERSAVSIAELSNAPS